MASKGAQVEAALAGYLNKAGNPLAGGKVWTYEAGTSTEATTWTDVDKNVAHANPIILDAQGQALIYGDGLYKFVFKNSNDATIDTKDYLQYFFISATITTATEITAADSTGITFKDDGGNTGITLKDGGNVGIKSDTNPQTALGVADSDTTAYASSISVTAIASDVLRLRNIDASAGFTSIITEAGSGNPGISRLITEKVTTDETNFYIQLKDGSDAANTVTQLTLTSEGDLTLGNSVNVGNIKASANTIESISGHLNLNPVAGSTVIIDGGATFDGTILTGLTQVTGTLQTAAQPNITSVGALDGGSITSNFGSIDNGVSNITTGGIITIDVDGTAENAAGSLTLGAGNDAGIFFDGTNLVVITNGAGASGIIFDSEDDTLEIKGSGVLQATFDTSGLNLVTGDYYSIAGSSVLNATTLGTAIITSSLTSVGALNSGSITSGFGAIDNGSSAITTTGTITGGTLTDGTFASTAGAVTGLTTLTVDNIVVNGNNISTSTGNLTLTPVAGSAVVIDGAASFDAGVVTGITALTATAITGTLQTAAQANVTSLGTLTSLNVSGGGSQAALVTGTILGLFNSVAAGTDCYFNIQSGTTGTAGITLGDSVNDDVAYIRYDNNTSLLEFVNSGSSAVCVTSTGSVGIGGESAPDGVLTIQGGSSGNAFTIKNSDMAHGITTVSETDTTLEFDIRDSGSTINAFTDIGNTTPLTIRGIVDTASTPSGGGIQIIASAKSGTGLTTIGSSGTLFSVANDTSTKFSITANGGIISNTNLFVADDVNSRVGIGTATPNFTLQMDSGRADATFDENDLTTWADFKIQAETATGNARGIYFDFDSDTGNDKGCGIIGISGGATGGNGSLGFITTAGNTSAESMRIIKTGEVGIGVIVPTAQLHVCQDSTTGAIPVLKLDQGDADQPLVDFIGIAAANSTNTVSTLTTSGATTHHLQVYVNGVKSWIATSTNAPT
tara:strand:- start:2576 stop:5464 length:2889 start_codon:yes stop_codon:yes gene_type:complete